MIQIAQGDSILQSTMFPDIEWLLAIMAKIFVIWGQQVAGETVQGYALCVDAIMRYGRNNMTPQTRAQILELVCIGLKTLSRENTVPGKIFQGKIL